MVNASMSMMSMGDQNRKVTEVTKLNEVIDFRCFKLKLSTLVSVIRWALLNDKSFCNFFA